MEKKHSRFTFPKFEETATNDSAKQKMLDEILKRLGSENPNFQEQKVREKLARYDQILKKYEIVREELKKEELEGEQEREMEQNVKQIGNGDIGTFQEKRRFDPENIKNPKKKELYDFLISEKKICEGINKEMEILEKKLYNVNLKKPNDIAVKLFEDSKEEINQVLEHFSVLEKEITDQVLEHKNFTKLNESSTDESDLDLDEELKDLKEIYSDLDREIRDNSEL